MLSIDFLPELFIMDRVQHNAFTFGTEERAYVVVGSNLLGSLTSDEMKAVLGHELGHVRSGHMKYHTLAEILTGAIGTSASFLGLGLVSIPLQMGLLSWNRESEVTADRAALLVVNDFNVVESLLRKLDLPTAGSRSSFTSSETSKVGTLHSISELFQTHPVHANRLKLLREFSMSQQFQKAKRKIELRQTLLRGLIPKCRFCNQTKATLDMFCPACGRCQV
jgi:Zn-dependent protease with chaperone function